MTSGRSFIETGGVCDWRGNTSLRYLHNGVPDSPDDQTGLYNLTDIVPGSRLSNQFEMFAWLSLLAMLVVIINAPRSCTPRMELCLRLVQQSCYPLLGEMFPLMLASSVPRPRGHRYVWMDPMHTSSLTVLKYRVNRLLLQIQCHGLPSLEHQSLYNIHLL